MTIRTIAVLLLLAGLFHTHPARAAQSYDNCNNFIDTLPATISTQGVWCLRHDLATNIASGNAIEIAANNVTIDCNDFKIGGLAAGPASQAIGIDADARQNITIRHCNIRGFKYGINLTGAGAGHLVEDNRLDNNLYIGIYVGGDNNRVRRNAIYDTGGAPASPTSYAIFASASITDNDIRGVIATATNANVTAIQAYGDVASGNRISNLTPNGTGYAVGITGFANLTREARQGAAARLPSTAAAASLPTTMSPASSSTQPTGASRASLAMVQPSPKTGSTT